MIYIDETGKVIENPDMTKGKIVDGSEKQVVIAHHDAVAEVSHWETMKCLNIDGNMVDYVDDSGKPIQKKVIDVVASPAYDDYDTQITYHAFTADEQAEYDVGLNTNAEIVALKKALEENTVALAELIGG